MRRIRLIIALAVIISYLAAVEVASSQEPPPVDSIARPQTPDVPPEPLSKHPKFSSGIAQLVEAAQSVSEGIPSAQAKAIVTSMPQVDAYIAAGLMHINELGQVQINVHVNDSSDDLLSELESRGAVIELQDETGAIIQARALIDDLEGIAELEQVNAVTLPKYGRVNAGSATSEGDAILDFDDLRSTFGVDGTGVTVGVISDGIFGLSNAVASGDLPATSENRDGSNVLNTTTGGVIAQSFRSDNDLEAGLGVSSGAEGTAMLEIIHDIAPGAQLRFANFSTALEFNQAVDFLAANSDIVVDDIAWFGFAYDQSSAISFNTSTELNRPTNSIRGYYTSVGNQARRHYQELYVDSGIDGSLFVPNAGNLHRFDATGSTTDCAGIGSSASNLMFVPPGGTATIVLIWDDTFGATTTDYDLYVLDSGTGAVVGAGIDDNITVTNQPVESLAVTNSTAGVKSYDLVIQNFENASVAKTFDMFILGGASIACNSGPSTDFNFNTMASSVPAQSDAGDGVISVGAINASDTGADDIASYSSRGPANNGATKPDVAAIDGVAVTGSGGFSNPFFGTSAAAPHVAGMAALLLEQRPDLKSGEAGDDPDADRNVLHDAIVNNAVDLGDVGIDNTFGHGRVNGLSSGQALELPTPTPTPTPEPIPSTSMWGLMALSAVFGLFLILRTRRQSRAG